MATARSIEVSIFDLDSLRNVVNPLNDYSVGELRKVADDLRSAGGPNWAVGECIDRLLDIAEEKRKKLEGENS